VCQRPYRFGYSSCRSDRRQGPSREHQTCAPPVRLHRRAGARHGGRVLRAGSRSEHARRPGACLRRRRAVGGQTISVDLSQGYYDPTVIEAKAGVPLEITFGQGQGCLAKVLIPAFSVEQDLASGGALVKLPAMGPGEYEFSCGMRMVFGKIVVK
jgi:hypothetical protein